MKYLFFAGLLIITMSGCKSDGPPFYKDLVYYFLDDEETWVGQISDFAVGTEDSCRLQFGMSHMPAPMDTLMPALKVSSYNYSGDLLTMIHTPVTDLESDAQYVVTVNIQMATNIPKHTPPDIAIGVGAWDTIPENLIDGSDWYRPPFQVRLAQGQSTSDIQMMGTLGITDTTSVYTAITRSNYNHPLNVTTNGYGTFYLIICWDSDFEGTSTLYIKNILISIESED
jgi:hypothetical protein